ncbi:MULTISPECIES: sodium/proline symporter [unclassified Ketobacter]|uniref:sodium/proline symporter n=1 Tax=unclassified Ketobacter TaxID=2639109 RepID=UPI000F11335E|nr:MULTISPECIES: sodium/proline symporter [unclassified Ketobacter]RLT88055.1 MAG: sodium/proline symporter [Ketobacter sp. GenoA1]RLT95185.1 MAG: sodium/proline symporter [Ketobacter sp.]
MVASFLFFLGLFVAIGLSSVLSSRQTKQDYYLASSSVSPALVGLSAVATNNSGYMFIGVIGYTYATGLAAIWIMVGWILGDFLASIYVHRRLRKATEASGEVSYAGVLSNWYGGRHDSLQRLIGLVSLVFLLAYASAQLVAGSKALQVLFGWPQWAGAVMGATLVLAYCWAGGIRASIWTDAAQSVVMIVAMGLLLVVATSALGGIDGSWQKMGAIDGFLDWFPKDMVLPGLAGGILFAISWAFAGMSVIGQPHIMVRFMALDDQSRMLRARAWYYLWFLAFYAMATGVGMLSRVYLGDPAAFDAELALPTMAQELFPPVLVGLVLAGIFAATLSTADSLILSCSAALTHDVLPHNIENTREIKMVTAVVCALALGWALLNRESVFSLVILAWSGLASAFAPLLLVLCFGLRPSQRLSIIAVVVGFLVSLVWRFAGLHGAVYEGMPAIIAGLAVLLVGVRLNASSTAVS